MIQNIPEEENKRRRYNRWKIQKIFSIIKVLE